MQFEKFVAGSVPEALEAVKAALGEEAVIVSTRPLGGGLFRRGQVEVTAAIEPPPAPQLFNQRPTAAAAGVAPAAGAAGLAELLATPGAGGEPGAGEGRLVRQVEAALGPLRHELRALRQALSEAPSPAPEAGAAAGAGAGEGRLEALAEQLREQFTGLRQMMGQLWSERQAQADRDPLLEILSTADVDPRLAQRLVAQVNGRREPRPVADSQAVLAEQLQALVAEVAGELRLPAQPLADEGRDRLALVGPPGVGKSLLVAKLTEHARSLGLKVALVGTDAWRIAAFEELAHTARLFDVPLTLAGDPGSFQRALEEHGEADLVLVDTAGRSAHQAEAIAELGQLFGTYDVRPVLTLPATVRHLELVALVEAYAGLDLSALAFTKLDEARVLGALLSASHLTGRPIHFLTGSHELSGGLVFTQPAELAERLVGMVLESPPFAWLNARPRGEAAPGGAAGGEAYAR